MGDSIKQSKPKRPASGLLIAAGFSLVLCLVIGVGLFLVVRQRSGLTQPKHGVSALLFNYAEPQPVAYQKYAGSQSCLACHEPAFTPWRASHHALAERPLKPELDTAAFSPSQTFKHGTQTSTVRFTQRRCELLTQGPSGKAETFIADRVIGHDPLRQYLIAKPDGRYQVAEIASDPKKGDWFNVYGNEDRQAGEWGHWTGRGMTWNTMCAACHNTRLRKNYQPATDTYNTAMVEMGVGCEACHGPMADHVAWQKLFPPPPGPRNPSRKDPTLQKMDKNQVFDTCGMCHARRGEFTGDFKPGDSFFDHHSLTIPDETDTFYPDGQIRDEDYEYTAFLGSRMYASKVRCIDCHDPHTAKPRLTGNALCLTCHSAPIPPAPRIVPATHAHHKVNAGGDSCTGCHMPITTYMQRHPRHDHGFTIPDPLLTKQFAIPNACNRCHTNQTETMEWALDWTQKWYGKKMDRPYRARATTIAKARNGEATALDALLKVAREDKNALWRASATGLARRWSQEPKVINALLEQAKDPAPMVRAVSARCLEPTQSTYARSVLGNLLNDPSRAVRVEAAWSLRTTVDTNSLAGQDLMRYLRHNLDQPSGLLQMGVFQNDRNDHEGALASFQKAVSWDGGSAPLHHALAVCLSQNGQSAAAVRELEIACKLVPRDAEYRFKLGLAYHEASQPKAALNALEEAVKLDPQYSQAWYNLGLSYSAAGQSDQALTALSRAEMLNAGSREIPYARATILARLGRVREARSAVSRALELAPGYSEAIQLLQTLSSER
ncbi:MAG: ammonia-forming cytochrome c nitrite reductase subunit c552 [Verrucomicrobiota bacterium]